MKRPVWEICTVRVFESLAEDNISIRASLSEGWEPFAVVLQEQSTKIVFLKRLKDVDDGK